ncbi:uncharacterized protein FIBRA_02517 [Fibroporia radiculosa]|uniref:DNA-(apurinic or apyrimidinic site) lyase n=1 Tax=Fibroporia radiculosa TaxID=599839 RepID=J4G1S0_9APHY|nr:uncharacterized protein FIBRA_02517 [Fibroporia radiculosa]CCM00483.1 predicted protein [Fibroporia radiculosa]
MRSIIPLAEHNPPSYEYRLCLRDRVICLRQTSDALLYRSVFPGPSPDPDLEDQREAETLKWIHDYFQLKVDLSELYKQWGARDAVFHSRKDRFSGIRMLRQDPFENLISFICSSNNNIGRITKMIQALCRHYSTTLVTLPPPADFSSTSGQPSGESHAYHPFPPPSVLAAPGVAGTLRTLGFGYRADFIQKTAKMLVDTHGGTDRDALEPAERWLLTLREKSTQEAREELLKFMGVGRKVADCILLMSLDKNEVIPVDTHVHQIAMKHYGVNGSSKAKTAMTPKLYDEVSNKLAIIWGSYAGWAHLVLFTSDLKSFASYGLPTPSPSPSVQVEVGRISRKRKVGLATLPTIPPPQTTSKSSRARAGASLRTDAEAGSTLPVYEESGLSMADRVKRRRRAEKAINVAAAS